MSALTNRQKLITHFHSKHFISESYRTLRTNILFASQHCNLRTIVVTSAIPGEGKSTTIGNLAIAFAQIEQKVLLIDADLRKPTIHHLFSLSNRTGLSNLLYGQCKTTQAITESIVPNLSIITAGASVPNPGELIASSRTELLLEELKSLYDVILIDTPPLLAVSDAQSLAAQCDAVIYVASHGKVKREASQKAVAKLEQVKANILGVVINNKKRSKDDYAYYE
ncbi:CpsD/CapB family tyrosine-protein kinase [Cohnella sp. GCM10027633]|uniref:CpsD/CapB family tyrosine-protein kinase n=1 Tax=unclassified Cohnella TaxID=2636738 RepID=UPI0036350454